MRNNACALALFLTFFFYPFVIAATPLETEVNQVRKDLRELRKLLNEHYSLGDIKKDMWAYDYKKSIDDQISGLKRRKDPISFEEYKRILKECLYESGDIGLDVLFRDSSYYCLPFRLYPVDGKYIVNISSCDAIDPGDELVSLDGLTPLEFLQALKRSPPKKILEEKHFEHIGFDTAKKDAWEVAFAKREDHQVARDITTIYGATSLVPSNEEVELVFKKPFNPETQYSVTLKWRRGTFDNFDGLASAEAERPYPYVLKEYTRNGITISAIHMKSLFFPKGENFSFYRELYAFIENAKQNADSLLLDLRGIKGGFPTNSLFLYGALCSPINPNKIRQTSYHAEEYARAQKRKDYCGGQLSTTLELMSLETEQTTSNPEYRFLQCLESVFNSLWNEYHYYVNEYKPNKSVQIFLSDDDSSLVDGFFPNLPSIPLYILQDSETSGEAETLIQLLKFHSHVTTAGELTKGHTSYFSTIDSFSNEKVARLWVTSSTPLIMDKHSNAVEYVDGVGIMPDIPISLTTQDLNQILSEGARGPLLIKKDLIKQKLVDHIFSTH